MAQFFALFKFEFLNVIRAKWLIFYGLFFFGFTLALLQFNGDPSRAAASLLNIVLLIVPMISVLYASIYWYNSETFTSLLLTQPLRRTSLYFATWLAISVGLSAGFVVSCGTAFVASRVFDLGTVALLLFGGILSFIFVGIGLLVSVSFNDRMRGIGAAFIFWLYFAVFHDAVVFMVLSTLKDYPIEIPGMILMASNPIDLARVSLLLVMDLGAMMGYTGKILQQSLSSGLGFLLIGAALLIWIVIPTWLGLKRFSRKDF